MAVIKPSTLQPSHAKVLLLFTLLAWSTMTMSTAESSSKAVIRRLDAGSTLNAAKESASIEQDSSSNVGIATSDQTNDFEERLFSFEGFEIPKFATMLKGKLRNHIQKFQLWWWRLTKKSALKVFLNQNLHLKYNRLFESKGFAKWVAFVKSSKEKFPEKLMFSILAQHYSDADLARILVAGTKVDKQKALATALLDIRNSKHKPKQDNAPGEMFALWRLHQIGTQLFESGSFDTWITFVMSKHERDWENEVLSILTKYYPNDAELNRILDAGTKVEKWKDFATKLQHQQHMGGQAFEREKTLEEKFLSKNLHLMDTQLFKSNAFAVLVTSMSRNVESPAKIMFSILVKYYPDDAKLANILIAGTKVHDESMKLFAGDLLDLQLKRWQDPATKKSPENSFVLWELHKIGTPLFESIAFSKWIKSITPANEQLPNVEHVYLLLNEHYPDDAELSRILVAGTKVDEQKALATALLDIRNSKHEPKQDNAPEEMFVFWRLHEIGTQLFESGSFDTWITFVMSKHERDWEKEVLSILSKYYPNNAELNRILDAGTKIDKWKDFATKLQDRQFNSWQKIHEKDKTPEEIFLSKNLHLMDTQLFESNAFAVLVTSMSRNVESPAKIMFSILVKYYPDDAKLANILIAGTKVHDERMKLFAGDLLDLQLKRWQDPATKKSPEEIIVLWELHKIGTPLFESIAFSKWIKSITPANEELPNVEYVYLLLNEHYPDDAELSQILVAGTNVMNMNTLATALLSAQIKQLQVPKAYKSFEKKFLLWELHKKDTSLFGSRAFAVLVTSMSRDVESPAKIMFSILVKYYPDDAKLANILIAGTKVQDESMKLFAGELLDLQLKRWRDPETSQTPEKIFELWKLHKIGTPLFENVAFSKWITFFKSGIEELPDMFLVYFALKVHLKEDGLTRIVEEGKKIPNMKSVADELKEFMDKMKKATEKLKEFGLEKIKIVDTLFKNQLFEKYESYMRSAFGSKSDMVVIKMLEDNLGDTIVAKQIAAGIVKPGAELMAEWRTKQFKLWLIEGKQPDDVKSKSKANAADELLKQVWRAYEIFHGKRKVT